jgi:signal transduction histidine kinase
MSAQPASSTPGEPLVGGVPSSLSLPTPLSGEAVPSPEDGTVKPGEGARELGNSKGSGALNRPPVHVAVSHGSVQLAQTIGLVHTTPSAPALKDMSPEAIHTSTGILLERAIGQFHADAGFIALIDDRYQQMVVHACRGSHFLDGSHLRFTPIATAEQLARWFHDGDISGDEWLLDQTPTIPWSYRCGERFVGYVWETSSPAVLTWQDCCALRAGQAPPDPEAAWLLGVPIYYPEARAFLEDKTATTPSDVMGVLVLLNRDVHWPFAQRDAQFLSLHADRIALILQNEHLARQRRRQEQVLNLLHHLCSSLAAMPDLDTYLRQIYTLVSGVLDASLFQVLHYHERSDEVSYELIADNGIFHEKRRLPSSAMPPWWAALRDGTSLSLSATQQPPVDPLNFAWEGANFITALLAVPMIVQGRLVGALVAASNHLVKYDPADLQLLEMVARAIGVTIETARLWTDAQESLRQAREKTKQMAALNNMVLAINSSLDLQETLQHLVSQAPRLTGAQICTVFLLDQTGEELIARATNGDYKAWGLESLETFRLKIKGTRLENVLATGQFLLLDDVGEDQSLNLTNRSIFTLIDLRSVLVLPVVHQQRPLGVLTAHTPGQRYVFTPEEIGHLQSLASQAATAISNAQLYQELQQAYERQKELDRLKDDFIVTASHEFRTPLSCIHGYASLLERHSGHLKPEQARRFATEISRATQQLVGLMTTLVDASRIDSQKLALVIRPIEARSVVESALALVQPTATQQFELDVHSGLYVRADRDRLRQVLVNLLTNAVKYSPAESTIRILVRREQQSQDEQAGESTVTQLAIFSVIDQGEGIAPEDQPQLFQKFVRLPRSLVTPVRGTGLGLYICREYITAMGGSIWVESELGHGSTFSFTLPLANMPPQP